MSYTESVSGRIFNSADYTQLVWDGSQFLAAGDWARRTPLVSSSDGSNWALRYDPTTPPPSNAVSGVTGIAYSAALGVYVSTQVTQANGVQLLYSSNLAQWSVATRPVGWNENWPISSIASNGAGFVAVGNIGFNTGTLISADGINWTQVFAAAASGGSAAYVPDRIHYFNGKYYGIQRVAFTNDLFEWNPTTTTWDRYAAPALRTNGPTWADVSYANGTFAIAARNYSMIYTSTDQLTWTAHTIPNMINGFISISSNGSGFIAVGVLSQSGSVYTSFAVTGAQSSGSWTWTSRVIAPAVSFEAQDAMVINGKTVIVGRVLGIGYTVSPRVGASGGGTVSAAAISVASGGPASFVVTPNAGNVVLSVAGCGATFVGNTVTTAAVTANCTVTVTFGVQPAACTLDIDDDGFVRPTTDGLLVLRRMATLGNDALRANAYNPMGNRTDPIAMAALIDPMIATKTLDIDGDGTVTAATDGLLLVRALLGFSDTAVTNGALGAGTKSRGDWGLIRQYLSSTCGLGAVLAP